MAGVLFEVCALDTIEHTQVLCKCRRCALVKAHCGGVAQQHSDISQVAAFGMNKHANTDIKPRTSKMDGMSGWDGSMG